MEPSEFATILQIKYLWGKVATDVPGSGNYHPELNDMSDSGKYVLSKYKGDGKRRFAKSFRDSFVDKPSK